MKERTNTKLFPRPWERSLTEEVQNTPVIASVGEAIQPIFNSKFVDESTSSQPSPQGEGERSCVKLIGKFPSPREEGVGERVQLEEKINPSLKIVSFRKMLKDNFSLSLGERSKNPCDQSEIIRSSLSDLLQSNCLSLRMTNALDNSCKGSHAELVSASLAGAFGQRFRNKFGMTINHNKLRYPEQSEGTEGVSLDNGLTPHPSLLPKEKENFCGHSELVSESLSKRIVNCPSPREEGVGERRLLVEFRVP